MFRRHKTSVHYHNHARVLKGINGNSISRSRRQTRSRHCNSFVSAKANFKKGMGRRSSFSAFLPFIEIAATPGSLVLLVAETRRINEETAFVCLTQFVVLFRAAVRWITIFSNISRNIQCRAMLRRRTYRGILFNRIFSM